MSSEKQVKIKYTLAVVIYGTIGLLLRYINVPTDIVALCRGVIGSLFTLAYLRVKGKRLDKPAIRANLKWLICSGICLGLNWVFLFAAYTRTTVAVASLCNYMAPTFAVLLSPVLFREKLTKKKIICVLCALLGIVLVSGVIGGGKTGANPIGVLLGLMAAATFVGIIYFNKKIKDIGSFDKTVIQLAVSALTILPYSLIANAGVSIAPDTRSLVLILVLGIVHTGVAYILYFSGMGTLPVLLIAVLGYLEPVVSVLCSVFFLHEPMGWLGWVGALLIVGASLASETASS